MTLSAKYKTNKDLFSTWQQTQVSYFKQLMSTMTIDFMKAGKIFSNLADNLDRIPSYEEFKNELNK